MNCACCNDYGTITLHVDRNSPCPHCRPAVTSDGREGLEIEPLESRFQDGMAIFLRIMNSDFKLN